MSTRNSPSPSPSVHALTLLAQRWLIAGLLGLAPLVFWRATLDIFGIVKAAAVAAVAVVVLAVAGVRAARTGQIVLPRHPASLAVAAFLLLTVLATVTSYAPTLSLAGHYARFSGLVMYTLYAALFVSALRAFDLGNIRLLTYGVLAGGAGLTLYAVSQQVGIDPIPWGEHVGVTSTVGNPNYVGAHVAIITPLGLWATFDRRLHPLLRAGTAVVLVAVPIALFAARANQGFLAASGGVAIFALAWLRGQRGRVRRVGHWVWGGAVATGALAFLAALAGRGPLGFIADRRSFKMRSHDMLAAWNMLVDNPLLGVGFDRFGGFYHSHRAPEATHYQSLEATTSAPHSVHLNMLASGGVPLGVAYLAFVGIVAWVLIRALLRVTAPRRLLLVGGLGGGWVAYQMQALISIDVPSLAVTGWLLAAGVLVVADQPELRSWWLPWARPSEEEQGKGKQARTAAALRRVRIRRVGTPASVTVVVVALAALWLLWPVLRADVNAKDAERLARADDHETAVVAAQMAYDTNTWEPRYGTVLGRMLVGAGDLEGALEVFEDTLLRDSRDHGATVSAARIAEQLDDLERAERWFRRALELEPNDPDMAADAGRLFLRVEQFEEAVGLFEHAVAMRDDEVRWWVRLGFARENVGDDEGARAAYEQALAVDPDDEEAQAQLSRFDGEK